MAKAFAKILKENDSKIRMMKAAGCSSYEIADVLGIVSPDSVRHYCSIHQIKLEGGRGSLNKNDQADVAVKIKELSNGLLEYVSGYVTKDSQILVRCTECGGEFERTYHHLTTHQPIVCPCCVEAKRRKAKAQAEYEREERLRLIAQHKAEKEAEAERKRLERETPHACPVCGSMTTRPIYCSDACAIKANDKAKENKRRAKIQNAMVDKDITVKGLFIRDMGLCKICGKPCDEQDFVIKDGVKICGNDYPSIDHIIPLARGGLHSWDNVQLAHRICNSKKRDHIYG